MLNGKKLDDRQQKNCYKTKTTETNLRANRKSEQIYKRD